MDFVQIVLSFFAIVFATTVLPALWRHVIFKYKLSKLDGPKGLPLLGNLLQLGSDGSSFIASMTKWAEEYRDKGSFLLYFGLIPVVVIINAHDTERIVSNPKLHKKAYTYEFIRPWVGDGLFMSVGSKWSSRRKLLTPSFHFSILSKFLDVFNEHATALAQRLCELTDRSHVDILPVIKLCSLDIVYETVMGLQIGAQKGEGVEYIKAVNRIQEIFSKRLGSLLYWNEALFRQFPLGKEQARCVQTVRKTTQRIIRERKVEMKDEQNVVIDDESQEVRKRRRLALLDLLIESQKKYKSFTDEDIQEEVNTFLFGGYDTVSTATCFALYLIGRHPEVQRKLQEELDQVFGDDRERLVTTEDMGRLEYLSCVVKESLRLLSPAIISGREIEEDVNVCGGTIPKGTTIFIAHHWLHRDPQQFPNPEIFDPERFLPNKMKERHNFAFLPFSGGPRNCIGQKFALMEEKVILATVLRKLKVTSLQTMDELGLANELVLRATNGVKIQLSSR